MFLVTPGARASIIRRRGYIPADGAPVANDSKRGLVRFLARVWISYTLGPVVFNIPTGERALTAI